MKSFMPCTLVSRRKNGHKKAATVWTFLGSLAIACLCTGGLASADSSRPNGHDQIGAASSYVVLAMLNDQVFGSTQNAMVHVTPTFSTSWRSNERLVEGVTHAMEGSGRHVAMVPATDIQLPKGDERSLSDATFEAISRAISERHPELQADVHLVIRPIPLDALGGPYRPASYFLTGGFLGLMSENTEKFRPAYLVKENDFLAAASFGKVECIMGYSLVALDANTHRILAKSEDHILHHRLPDDFKLAAYSTLSDEQKTVLEHACVDGMLNSVGVDLQSLGFRAEPSSK